MTTTLSTEALTEITERLRQSNQEFAARYPGETGRRQPVHTVYGGAHLFKAETTQRLGALALRALEQSAPGAVAFAKAVGLPGADGLPDSLEQSRNFQTLLKEDPEALRREHKAAWMAHTIYERVMEKLRREPVEDFRIDFEDCYGNRPDAEEDGHAESAAAEVAAGLAGGTLSPFVGIRIKPFNEEL